MLLKQKKSRKGISLTEVVIALALLGTILVIVMQQISLSTANVRLEAEATHYQRGVDAFLYNLLLEMKSAESVAVSGDSDFPVLQIIGYDAETTTYEVNNLRGTIYRNRHIDKNPVADGILQCQFFQEDETAVTITIALDRDEIVEYTMYCGF